MGRYIQSFANNAAIQAALDNEELLKPYVAYKTLEGSIDFNTRKMTDWREEPLTFKILSDGTIKFRKNTGNARTIEYKINDGEWTSMTFASNSPTISVQTGDVVYMRGDNSAYSDGDNEGCSFNGSTASFNLCGNIMSLINSTNFKELVTLSSNYAFHSLFSNTKVVDASNLILPATTLTTGCYKSMFNNCKSLEKSPLIEGVPSTGSFNVMFNGCSNLNYIKCLSNSTNSNNTFNWVYGVSATGTFVKKAGVTWSNGNSGIPSGWTVVEE